MYFDWWMLVTITIATTGVSLHEKQLFSRHHEPIDGKTWQKEQEPHIGDKWEEYPTYNSGLKPAPHHANKHLNRQLRENFLRTIF